MAPELEPHGDIRARLVGVEKDLAAYVQRMLEMERWRTKTDIDEARRSEQWVAMKTQLASIDGTLTWLNRIVIGAVLTAVVLFILKGGLSLPNI